MNKTKLTQKEIAVSILLFIFGIALLAGLIVLMLLIRTGSANFGKLIADNYDSVITVSMAIVVIFVLTYFYFFFENKNLLASGSKVVELFLLLYVCYAICAVMDIYIDAMARPLLLYALLVGKLTKRKDAIFLNTIFAFVLVLNRYLTLLVEQPDTYIGNFQVELIIRLLIIFCGGIVAIFMIQRVKTRMGSVMVTFVLFIPVVTLNMAMQLPYMDPASTGMDMSQKILEIINYSVLNCIFSMLLFLFLLPIFEVVFAELTTFRLRELTSDSSKLMKKLKENASGTYNHSIVLAQLAESCAIAINEDAELARAVAYYHDIGKLKNPEMFTENQRGYNVHNELTPELSVDIIRSHARDGAKLLKSHHLPEIFADVALQHHGTMPIKYFYAKALKLSDGTLNPANYSYSGPTPTTKIAAIIMICDASEAAARSLSDRSPEKVEALVRGLVEERMNMDQFVDCDITLKELSVIISTLVNNLTGVYHERIAYPKLVLSKHNK